MAAHLSDSDTQAAVGAVAAQEVVTAISAGAQTGELAWLRYVELAAQYGKHAPACRAFLLELVKHSARPN